MIGLVPHLYEINWAKDLNSFLANEFFLPVGLAYGSYMRSRDYQHLWQAKALCQFRKREIDELFFVNFNEDFNLDYLRILPVKKLYGIVHGSNFLEVSVGKQERIQEYELAVAGLFDKIFISSKSFADQLPYKTEIVGLPIFGNYYDPSESDGIIFSSRLNAGKRPLLLLDLPEKMRKNLTVCAARLVPHIFGALKKELPRVMYSPPDYKQILRQNGFWISFSEDETFCYSMMDAIQAGLFPIAPDDKRTFFPEFLPVECLYSSLDEAIEIYEYYSNNKDERFEVVEGLQAIMEVEYSPQNWLNNVMRIISE